jgi:hypothetical protein
MNGRRSASGRSSILLAAILACGASAAYAIGWSWLAGVASQWRVGSWVSESLVVTRDGTALVESRNRREHTAATYRTMDGEPLSPEATDELNRDGGRMLEEYVLLGADSSRERTLAWQERICGFIGGGGSTLDFWYLIHDGQPIGHAYLAGFDSRSKRAIGYLGRAGFGPAVPLPEQQFEMDARLLPSEVACVRPWWGLAPSLAANERYSAEFAQVFLASAGTLYRIDLASRAVRTVPLPQPVISMDLASIRAATDGGESSYERRLLVRTSAQLITLDLKGKTISEAHLPDAVRDQDLSVYLPTTGQVVLRVDAQDDSGRKILYWLGAGEEEPTQGEVHLARHSPPNLWKIAWGQAVMFPSPLLFGLARVVVTPREYIERYQAKSYPAALARSLSAAWPALVPVSLLAAGLAAVLFRHHRRCAERGGAAWALFVLLAGVPGAVGYCLHRTWPAQERCGWCGAIVPRNREDCLSCGAEFPEPAPRGIEILA